MTMTPQEQDLVDKLKVINEQMAEVVTRMKVINKKMEDDRLKSQPAQPVKIADPFPFVQCIFAIGIVLLIAAIAMK